MTSNMKVVAQKVLASMTMTATVLSLSGFAMLAPVSTALAAVPADYGLREGDTISSDGIPSDPNYDPDIYIVNDLGYKRLFLNPVIFNFYGHLGSFANVKKVSPAARDAFPTSGLFRNCETNDQRVWGVEVVGEDTGVLHWVNTTGAQATIDDANFFRKVFCINNNEFNWYPKGSDYTSVNQVPDYNRASTTGSPTPTPTPTGGQLNGGAGSLQNADFIGSLNNEEVGEGESNIAVTGLDLEADNGSDLRVTSVRVSLEQVATVVSDDLDDYADEVSVWFDGAKVATADVSDFDEDANVWSKAISLTGDAVVRMSQTKELRVAVSALEVIDSVDLATNAWQITIENVRYVDAQGAVTTETSLDNIGAPTAGSGLGSDDRAFSFESFASAADLELNLNEASDNPDARVVDVDDNSGTDNVVLLTGDLEATGGDILVKELTVNFATTGAEFDSITDSISLEVDGDVVQTISTSGSECVAAAGSTRDCTFDDVDADINEDDTVKIRVLADINGTDDFSEGATLTATITNSATDAEDQNGDSLASGDKTGAANGNAQAFYDEGIQTTFVDSSAEFAPSGIASVPDVGTFVIEFDVMAFGNDAFVDNSCALDASGPPSSAPTTPGQGVIFYIASTSTATAPTGVTCDLDWTGDTSDESANNFEVSDGATEHFTLTVHANGNDGFAQVVLESINWATTSSATDNQFYTFDLSSYKTDSVYGNNN